MEFLIGVNGAYEKSDMAKGVAWVKNRLHYNTTHHLLLIIIGIFSVASPYFFSFFNLNNMIMQNAHVFVAMTGLLFVMQGGGIHLSVGYQVSLVSVVIGSLLAADVPILLALCAGLITGILCGTIKLPPKS